MRISPIVLLSVVLVAFTQYGCSARMALPKDATVVLRIAERMALPEDATVVLRAADLEKINRGLSTDHFVLAIPTGAEGAPSGCPNSTSNHCIWICTGQEPLDSIDDNTCSTNTWKCPGCGDGDSTVCQDGNGKTVPC